MLFRLSQYIDTYPLFVVYKGRGRFSWIDGNELQPMDMEEGDCYAIERDTIFHYENIDILCFVHPFHLSILRRRQPLAAAVDIIP